MKDRIDQELYMLRTVHADLVYIEEGQWILIPNYKIGTDIWNRSNIEICLQIPVGYPGNAPYGFYVKSGLVSKDTSQIPTNYEEPANTPFDGVWGKFSWAHDDSWRATADVKTGSNLLNFVHSIQERLREGI